MSMNTSNPCVAAYVEEDEVPLPHKLQKISARISELSSRICDHKKEATYLYNEFNLVKRMFDKYAAKVAKIQTKASMEQKKRKPSGFARPTRVSSELCVFMGRSDGEMISRTETSRFLSKYISDNALSHPQKKNVILPDESLAQLLGDEAKDAEITYFTIQKYINRHFAQKTDALKIEGDEVDEVSLVQGL